jgi:serine/threonine protein kinase
MTGNQARINSDMILNDQAGLLSYGGEQEIEECRFEIGKKLGGGSFGSVYEGTTEDPNKPEQKIKVAIKTVNNPRDESQVYALMCEIKVLEKLEKHLNLVNMIRACTAGHDTGRIWLLLEYCPCGDMKHFLHKNRDVFMEGFHNQEPHKSLNLRLFIKWGYGIAKGMEYLSSMKIMHGDLAARNILISNLDSDNYLAKITDFGLSKAFYEKTSYLKQVRRNVPWKWMDVDFLETSIFTMSSDVWSFGVVFWEMLSIGRTPYAGCNANDTIKEIKAGLRLSPPDEISQFPWLGKCYNEVTKMGWHSNPKQRSSFSNLAQTFETYLTTEEKEDYARMNQNIVK